MWYLLGFSTESCYFPFSILCSLGVTRLVLAQRRRENKVHLIDRAISTDIIWNSSIRNICLLSPFIIESHISMDLCVFLSYFGLQSNAMLYILLLKLLQFGHWELLQIGSGVPLIFPSPSPQPQYLSF